MSSAAEVKALFEKHNQGHVFKYWDTLSQQAQEALLAQTREFNVALLKDIFETSMKAPEVDESLKPPADADVKNLADMSQQEQVRVFFI